MLKAIDISPDESRQLALEYQTTGNQNRKNDIANRLILGHIKLVMKISTKFTSPKSSNYDDYLMVGCRAIVDAINPYDGSTRFSTYIYRSITWNMENYRSRKSNVVKKVHNFDSDGESNYISYDMTMSEAYYEQEFEKFSPISVLLECDALTDYERMILEKRVTGLMFREIGEERGVSTSAIKYSYNSALVKLRLYARQLGLR